MKIEGISFYEALKSLAERYGIPMPKRSQYADEDARMRGALLQMHELAQEHSAPTCTVRRARRRGPIWRGAA